jgi:hypothetical protein
LAVKTSIEAQGGATDEAVRQLDEDDEDSGVAYKSLTIVLDSKRVRLFSRGGEKKSEQPYSGSTWIRPVGRHYFAVCVRPPIISSYPSLAASWLSSVSMTRSTCARLRYCRAPSREARDLLIVTFRAFAGGSDYFFSQIQLRAPALTSSACHEYLSSVGVYRDILELEAVMRADNAIAAAATAAGATASAAAFAVKGVWLSEVINTVAASTATPDDGGGGCRASETNVPSLHLPMVVVSALAKTYWELAALVGSIPVSTWTP